MPLSDKWAAKRRRSAGFKSSGARSPANCESCARSSPYGRRVFSDMPRACSQPSERLSAAGQPPLSSMLSSWVNTEDGRVATYDQLDEAGLVEDETPAKP